MNQKILRKLGATEISCLTSVRAQNFAENVRLTSSLDLFSKLGVLNRTIRQWASTHALLLAKVATIDGHNYFVQEERFVGPQLDDWRNDESDLENVKYLKLDSAKIGEVEDKSTFFDDIASLLCQRELSVEIDCFNELMWKVQVLEIPTGDGAETKEYYFTVLLQHAISEGRNLHVLMLQLFDLIEHNFTMNQNPKLPGQYPARPSIQEVYFDHFDRTNYSNKRVRDLPLVPWPAYLDMDEASLCPPKTFAWQSAIAGEWIYRIGRNSVAPNRLIRLQDLVEASKQNNMASRVFSLSKHQTSQLVAQ